MKNKILISVLLMLYSSGLLAEDIVLPELKGFRKLTKYPVYTAETLWDFINGAANGYLELGFIDLHVAEYKKGKDIIKLEVYRHSDHTSAFGIYASERTTSYDFIKIGAQGYKTEGSVNFFKGNYYVKIRTFSDKSKIIDAVETLARRVETMLDGSDEMPELLSLFPDEGKKINEENYINESVLGHSFLNNAFKALYQTGNDVFGVYLFKFRSAGETYETASRYLSSAGIETESEESGKYAFSDGYNGNIFIAWKGDMMVVISDLAKDQADIADIYTSAILK